MAKKKSNNPYSNISDEYYQKHSVAMANFKTGAQQKSEWDAAHPNVDYSNLTSRRDQAPHLKNVSDDYYNRNRDAMLNLRTGAEQQAEWNKQIEEQRKRREEQQKQANKWASDRFGTLDKLAREMAGMWDTSNPSGYNEVGNLKLDGPVSNKEYNDQFMKAAVEANGGSVKVADVEREKYGLMRENPDFEEYSKYTPDEGRKNVSTTMQMADVILNGKTANKDMDYGLLYDALNGDEDARKLWGSSAIKKKGYENVAYLSDEERDIFNYLYKKEGPEAVDRYMGYLTKQLNARARQQNETDIQEFASDHPVAGSALSVIASPFKIASTIGQGVDYALNGEVDQNANYNMWAYMPNAIRNQVSEDIAGAVDDGSGSRMNQFAQNAATFGYQTTLSMLDNLLNMSIGNAVAAGGSADAVQKAAGAASQIIMSSGAAADTMIDARDKGRSSNEALTLATVAGLAEWVTEKWSVDALFDADLLRDNAVKYVAKNMLSEGSEEVASDLINTIADVVVLRDRSEWAESIRNIKAEHPEWSDARVVGQAIGEKALEMGVSFLGGAISGGVLSGANAGRAIYYQTRLGQSVNNSADSRDILYQAAEEASDNASFMQDLATSDKEKAFANTESKRADDFLQKVVEADDNGQKLSNREIGRQMQINEDNMSNTIAPKVYETNDLLNKVVQEAAENDGNASEDTVLKVLDDDNAVKELSRMTGKDFDKLDLRQAVDAVNEFASNVTREYRNASTIAKFSEAMGENGARIINNSFADSGIKTAAEYASAVNSYYSYGANLETDKNIDISSVIEAVGKDINPEVAMAAVFAGYNDRTEGQITAGGVYEKTSEQNGGSGQGWKYSLVKTESDSGVRRERTKTGTGTAAGRLREQSAKAVINAQIRDLGTRKVSGEDLGEYGLAFGTDKANNYVFDKAYYNDEMRLVEARNKTLGYKTVFVTGSVETFAHDNEGNRIQDKNGNYVTELSRGVFLPSQKTIILQADNKNLSLDKISRHEYFHMLFGDENNSERKAAVSDAVAYIRSQGYDIDDMADAYIKRYGWKNMGMSMDDVLEEVLADAYAGIDIWDYVSSMSGATKYTDAVRTYAEQLMAKVSNHEAIDIADQQRFSRELDDELYQKAVDENDETHNVSKSVMKQAGKDRAEIKGILDKLPAHLLPEEKGMLSGVDRDEYGNKKFTVYGNSSYSKSVENTSVCIRSLAMERLFDQAAKKMGHSITTEEAITLSQMSWALTDEPTCQYCYVFADRVAERNARNEYIKQRDAAIEKLKKATIDHVPTEDELNYSVKGKSGKFDLKAAVKAHPELEEVYRVYSDFGAGRKNTENMQRRFARFVDSVKNGTELVKSSDVTTDDAMLAAEKKGGAMADEIADIRRYASNASHAKAKVAYTAYNNDILAFSNDLVNDLNKEYGLRFYSYSDYHPAFLLENMQMYTDAAVKGLKGLAYTKDIDYARIFEPTGANINISTKAMDRAVRWDSLTESQKAEYSFMTPVDGMVYMPDAMQGANWAEAIALRQKSIENGTGISVIMVCTSDKQVEWAMKQEWCDVIIPYHVVFSQAIKDTFLWKNYKAWQEDKKIRGKWHEGNAKHVTPIMHGNDLNTYLKALEDNNLSPRFEQWLKKDPENYMKLVNETRRSYRDTQALQPIFNMDEARKVGEKLENGKGYDWFGHYLAENEDVAEEFVDRYNAGERYNASVGGFTDKATADLDHDYAVAIDTLNSDTATKAAKKKAQKYLENIQAQYGFNEAVEYDSNGNPVALSKRIQAGGQRMSTEDTEYMELAKDPEKNEYRLDQMVGHAAFNAGYKQMMFHETSADNIHVFDISRGDHSATDSETPYGIFTKSRDNNIGIGDRQMKLYVKAENTLNVASREYVSKYIPDLVPYYDEIKRLDDKYGDLAEKAMDREMELLEAWSDAHPEADMEEILPLDYIIENKPAKIDDAAYLAAHKHYEDVMAEWTKASDVVRVKCKDIITDYLRDNGYDSMYLFIDAGSNGRQTDALIVLDENQVKSANTVTYDDNGNVIPLSERFNSGSNDIRYSTEIKEGMSDDERYEVLKDTDISVPSVNYDAINKNQKSFATLENAIKSQAEPIILDLSEKLGILGGYKNPQIELEFNYSKNSLRESLHKQSTRGGNFSDFGKMMTCFKEVVESAIPIEIHSDKYAGTRRASALKSMYVMVSAFEDGDRIVPVQLEIKEFAGQQNKLYVSVTLSEMKKTAIMGHLGVSKDIQASPTLSKVTLSNLFANVNVLDGEFLKYVPDNFLDSYQIESKRKALTKQEEKIKNLANGIRNSTEDSDGNTLTSQQQEYFRDSKIRDDDGKLIVMYHGSESNFTTFENRPARNGRKYGDGFYFTENQKMARSWGKGNVYKTYLNITNPLTVSANEAVPEALDNALRLQYGDTYDEMSANPKWFGNEYTKEEYIENNMKHITNSQEAFFALEGGNDVLKEHGYDGIVVPAESWMEEKHYAEAVAFDSNQIKSVTNQAPTSDPDIRYSTEDAGYHAGDLGKAESYAQQGYYRGTGHFGTGTYFVGDESLIEKYNMRNGVKAPHEKVDFSKYNLYRPGERLGLKLHEALKVLDGGIDSKYLDAAIRDEFQYREPAYKAFYDRLDKYRDEGLEWEDAKIAAYQDELNGIDPEEIEYEFKTYDEFFKNYSKGWEDIDEGDYEFYKDEYVDYLKAISEEYNEKDSAMYNRLRDAVFNLQMMFGFNKETEKALRDTLAYQEEMQNASYEKQKVSDSLATVFMKSLGYEGIDVRGTNLDNVAYGSVIYDLKGKDLERKKAIGTARYSTESMSDAEQSIRDENDYLKGAYASLLTEVRTDKRSASRMRTNANKTADRIREEYESRINKADLRDRMNHLVQDYIIGGEQNEGLAYQNAKNEAVDIARDIVNNAGRMTNADEYDRYLDLKKRVKNNDGIYLDPSLRGDPEKYQEIRKRLFGKVNLKNSGTPLDSFYQGLVSDFGELFDPDVAPGIDQLQTIEEVLNTLAPIYENPYNGRIAEAIELCANDILMSLTDGTIVPDGSSQNARQQARVEKARQNGIDYARKAIAAERVYEKKRIDNALSYYRNRDKNRLESAERERLRKIANRLNNRKLPKATRELLEQYIGELDLISVKLTNKRLDNLKDLRLWYEDQQTNNPDFVKDPEIEKLLQRLSTRQISELDIEEVRWLTTCLQNIENELAIAKKTIDTEDQRDIHIQAEESMADIDHSKGNGNNAFTQGVDSFFVNGTLSPVRAMKRIVGYRTDSPIYQRTLELEQGQIKSFDWQRKAEANFLRWTNDNKFMESIVGKKAKMIDIGNGIQITPAMRMSLYLHSKNEQNMRHIIYGGITVPNMKAYKSGNMSKAYGKGSQTVKLTAKQVRDIIAGMTDQEKTFADAAAKYFNGMSQESINEVSEKLKGYSLALVDNYFPINTNSNFTLADYETVKMDGTIEGMGFLKERQNASNPIYLRDITDVLNKSISSTAKYVGLAIPVRNFNKLYNVSSSEFGDEAKAALEEMKNAKNLKDRYAAREKMRNARELFTGSMRESVMQNWDVEGIQYIEKMMGDIQNPKGSRSAWAKMFQNVRGNYAGSTLGLSASVAMKQAASYPTAAAVLGWKPLNQAFLDVTKIGRKFDMDLVNKYTPLLWHRASNFNVQYLGNVGTSVNQNLLQKLLSSKALNWITDMDVATTRLLWYASEHYVQNENKALVKGSDAYYKAVAEVYNRVITETQPNYTTMERPDLLRTDDTLLASMMMFKTQSFQNFNVLYDAIGNYSAKKDAVKLMNSDENKAALTSAKKDLSRAVSSQVVQTFVFAAMTAVCAALLGRKDKYKDDEGEVTMESLGKQVGKDMISSAMSMVPFGGEIYSVLARVFLGEKYYGFDNITASSLDDLFNAFIKAADSVKSGVDAIANGGELDWNEQRINLDSVMNAVTRTFGIPYDNASKIFEAVVQHVANGRMGEYEGTYTYLRLTKKMSDTGAYYDNLFKAYVNDKKSYEALKKKMIADGFDEEKMRNAINSRLKDKAGVNSVSDLDHKLVDSKYQNEYDAAINLLLKSPEYKKLSDDEQGKRRTAVESTLKDPEKMQKLDDAGIDVGTYALYLTARKLADIQGDNNGSYSKDEKAAAVKMLLNSNEISSAEASALKKYDK